MRGGKGGKQGERGGRERDRETEIGYWGVYV